MENKQLESLSREQLADVITETLNEIGDCHGQVMNTAYLWDWASNEQQEACCRSFADGLDVGRQMLSRAISTKTAKGSANETSSS